MHMRRFQCIKIEIIIVFSFECCKRLGRKKATVAKISTPFNVICIHVESANTVDEMKKNGRCTNYVLKAVESVGRS